MTSIEACEQHFSRVISQIGAEPQYVIYAEDVEKKGSLKHPNVSAVIYDSGDIQEHGIFEDKRFFSEKLGDQKIQRFKIGSFKPNFYLIRECEGRKINPEFLKVILEFPTSWNRLILNSITCIASVLESIYNQENLLGEVNDLNMSFVNPDVALNGSRFIESNSDITDKITIYRYQEVAAQTKYQSLNLQEGEQLKDFLDGPRMSGIEVEEGTSKIPDSIQALSFLHFFLQINSKFCKQYIEKERQIREKQNYRSQMLLFVFNHICEVSSLVQTINHSYLLEEFKCNDMQKYINFITFQFRSMHLIRSVIRSYEFSVGGEIHKLFEDLMPKKLRIVQYIISLEDKIGSDEPIHYYDLFLKIVIENTKDTDLWQISFIILLLHYRKANKISINNLHDNNYLVSAIISFAKILQQKDKIPQIKKHLINANTIEIKIANLLKIVGLLQQAIKFYKRNHRVKSIDKCFRKIIQKCKKEEKAEKYMQFAQYFIKEVQIAKAMEYYREAYQFAGSNQIKRKAINGKLSCVAYKAPVEDRHPFDKFIKDGVYADFASGGVNNSYNNEIIRLQTLVWDSSLQQAIFVNGSKNTIESPIKQQA